MTNKKTQPFNSPAFIVGKERSGTTLLSSILNRHPIVCVTPETDFLYQLSQYPEGNTDFEKNWPKSLFSIIDRMNPTDDWDKPAHLVFKHLNEKPVSGKKAFIALGEVISNRYGKHHWIEKTPNHILCLPFIRQLFPRAPIIHIVRDGRDVSYSLTKVKFGSQNLFENLWLWMDAIRRFNAFSKNDSNHLTIRYEDLIQQPNETIQTICEYLKIDFFTSMLEPDGSEKSLIVQAASHMNQVSESIDINKLANWKKTLSPELQKTAFMIAHKELVQYGYGTTQTNSPNTLCISERLLLSKHHRQLYDLIIYTVANSKTPYILENVMSLNRTLPDKPPNLWIIEEIPLPKPEQRKNHISLILQILKIFKNIATLKMAGTKIIWILHPNQKKSQQWLVHKITELFMEKMSNIIILVEKNKRNTEQIRRFYRLNENKCLLSDSPELSYKLGKFIQ